MNAHRTRRTGLLVAALVAGAAVASAAPASAADSNPADPTFAPTTADLVGVGSDTSQQALHYLAEGKPGVGAGWNIDHASQRVASFAADGQPASITIRPGKTITRPNGSGAGKSYLYGQNNEPGISFARSSSAQSNAETSAGLKSFPFAVDGLGLAVKASGSHAPASIPADKLVGIYDGSIKNWSELGGSAGVIKPLIPQQGSGTRSFFVAQLKSLNGGADVALASSVTETQEHSDALIKNDPDAVAPFSTGRAKGTESVRVTGGFIAKRALYNVVRQGDATSPTTLSLFGSDGFVCSSAAKPLIEAAGFDQLARPSRGGVCGEATTGATSNFEVSDVANTTTTLAGSATPGGEVKLTATVAPITAEGTVDFYEGDTKVASDVEVDTNGRAVTTLTDVAKGAHEYTASFTSTDQDAFAGSSSTATSVTVPDEKYEGTTSVDVAATGAFGAARTVKVKIGNKDLDATGAASFVYGDAPAQQADLVKGAATFTIPADLGVGTYWGVVSHRGDKNFTGSFSLVKFAVTKASTTTKLSISPSKVKVKKTTKGTVTVAISGSTLKPSGKVTLKIGSSTVGTGTVKDGKAVVTIKASTKTGVKSVKATFTPSGSNYGTSTSATVKYTVTK